MASADDIRNDYAAFLVAPNKATVRRGAWGWAAARRAAGRRRVVLPILTCLCCYLYRPLSVFPPPCSAVMEALAVDVAGVLNVLRSDEGARTFKAAISAIEGAC